MRKKKKMMMIAKKTRGGVGALRLNGQYGLTSIADTSTHIRREPRRTALNTCLHVYIVINTSMALVFYMWKGVISPSAVRLLKSRLGHPSSG